MGVIRELENVQRRATKLMPTLSDLSYSERLQSLNLPSFSYCWYCMDLIMTYKIFNGAVLIDKDFYYEHKI